VHFSLDIIAGFSGFVKGQEENIFSELLSMPAETSCFPSFSVV